MSRDFILDLTERATKTAVQALLAVFVADATVANIDWPGTLITVATATLVSVLTSLLSLQLGRSGTASATDAVVTSTYADHVAAGRHAAGLADGPAE